MTSESTGAPPLIFRGVAATLGGFQKLRHAKAETNKSDLATAADEGSDTARDARRDGLLASGGASAACAPSAAGPRSRR